MKKARPQAKDIPDADVLAALDPEPNPRWMTHWPRPAGTDPAEAINGRAQPWPWSICTAVPSLAAFPEKVMRSKLASMMRRGLIDGCDCGCRGDWMLTEKGRAARVGR